MMETVKPLVLKEFIFSNVKRVSVLKKFIAVFSAILLMLCATACNADLPGGDIQNEENQAQGKYNIVNLAYNSADTFNPYTAKTDLNKNLCSLIFDSLVKIDSDFNIKNVLADSIETSQNICSVKIKNAYFSDGSSVTAEDVVYSFNTAKSTNEEYAAILAGIISSEAIDSQTVIFTANKSDPNISALLTFPVIKAGTDKLKNEDNVYLPPIGCGRYILNSENNGLWANVNWYGGNVNINEINLINTPDKESLAHFVEIGAIDYYYTDLSDCNIIRMSGERVNITLNNLVYIGVNMNYDYLNNLYLRHAISAALNRNTVCERGYYNNAIPATGIFNPKWQQASNLQTIENTDNQKTAIENLEKIGYNNKGDNGYVKNSEGNFLTLSLLVNSENSFRVNTANIIAEQLKAVGIKVNVNAVSYAEYTERLNSGNFELYLAEVKITDNMDISPLVIANGSVAYGIVKSDLQTDTVTSALENTVNLYYNAMGSINDIAVTAISEMPIIPVCYRTGVLFCSDRLSPNYQASACDIFFGFENINLK